MLLIILLHDMRCFARTSFQGIVANALLKTLFNGFGPPKEIIFCQPGLGIGSPTAWEEGLSGEVMRMDPHSRVTLWGKLNATTEATFKSVFKKERIGISFLQGYFKFYDFLDCHTHEFPTVAQVSFSLGAAHTWILPFSWFWHHRTTPRKSLPWVT